MSSPTNAARFTENLTLPQVPSQPLPRKKLGVLNRLGTAARKFPYCALVQPSAIFSAVVSRVEVELWINGPGCGRAILIALGMMGDSKRDIVEDAAALPELYSPLPSTDFFTKGAGQHASSRISAEMLYDVARNYVEYYAHGESHTARAKRYDLEYFLQFLAGSSEGVATLQVSDWTVQRTKDFVDSRLARGEAPATVSRRLATIKHFGRTLAERVPGYINPAREVKGPVLQQTRPHGLSPDEVDLLRQAAREQVIDRGGSFIAVRDRFLLELLLATGLRADEVRLLVYAQLSADLYWLKNVKTKGRRYRNVYLESNIREEAERYLEARDAVLREKTPGVFGLSNQEIGRIPVLISLYGSSPSKPESFGLSPKTVFNAIANLGKKAQGLSLSTVPNLHPHKLRHTFAHGLLDSSKDVRLVAQALGHSDVRTTMRYTERSEQEMASAIEEKAAHDRRRA